MSTLVRRSVTPRALRLARRKHLAFVPGKLIVRFKPDALRGAVSAVSRGARSAPEVLPEHVAGPLDLLRREFGLRRIEPLVVRPRRHASSAPAQRSVRRLASLAASVRDSPRETLGGYNVVELDTDRVPNALLKRIEASPAVDFVERVANRWTSSPAALTAADPALNLQWGLRAIEWFAAVRPDASGVEVAVLDTGVDEGHPDLQGAILAYDRGRHSAKDLPGHGTHVAGILAARANNGIGICGVADCRLRVWKVFTDPKGRDPDEKFDDEAYNQALAAVLDTPAKIVNLSLGGTERSRTEQDLIAALVAEGVLVVAAMGNEYDEGDPIEWPAAYDDVLAVGAVDETRKRAAFSCTGRHIGLMAPGENILSTLPRYRSVGREETDYAAWPGTSMATPCVSACAALLLAANPDKDGAWLAERLQATAVKLTAMRGKAFTRAYGHGLVNVAQALR